MESRTLKNVPWSQLVIDLGKVDLRKLMSTCLELASKKNPAHPSRSRRQTQEKAARRSIRQRIVD